MTLYGHCSLNQSLLILRRVCRRSFKKEAKVHVDKKDGMLWLGQDNRS